MATSQVPTIDRLLNLVPDSPQTVLDSLRSNPDIASKQDAHGYSLLHAAASYAHLDLLNALVRDFKVDPNIKDEDGETALFNVEDVSMAKALLDLGTDMSLRNHDGQLAAEKLDDEDEQPAVAVYLRDIAGGQGSSRTETATHGNDEMPQHPPPLPNGVQVNVGTMQAEEAGGEPDPEFRRRIEELAARGDFEGEEGQRELRSLVEDAVAGISGGEGQGSATRRRID